MNNWQQAGIKTPPAGTFKTFEDVKKAYADQLAYVVELMVKMTDIKDQLLQKAFPWAVFEEKLVTMEALVNHLQNDFEGAEELRQQLLNIALKHGNNDPKADDIALWIATVFDKEARKHKRPIDGGTYRGVLVASGGQVRHALNLGATPDGRRSGDPVLNSIAPANGTCTEGLTATLMSAAKVCAPGLSAGTSLTPNFNPATIKEEEKAFLSYSVRK